MGRYIDRLIDLKTFYNYLAGHYVTALFVFIPSVICIHLFSMCLQKVTYKAMNKIAMLLAIMVPMVQWRRERHINYSGKISLRK